MSNVSYTTIEDAMIYMENHGIFTKHAKNSNKINFRQFSDSLKKILKRAGHKRFRQKMRNDGIHFGGIWNEFFVLDASFLQFDTEPEEFSFVVNMALKNFIMVYISCLARMNEKEEIANFVYKIKAFVSYDWICGFYFYLD